MLLLGRLSAWAHAGVASLPQRLLLASPFLQAARIAAEAAAPCPRSSVFRRCCPWALPRLPWHRKQQGKRVSQAVERSESFADT